MADYASLQKLALSDQSQDEAVTVNQRALIDKILARYASDNTTLRELLQNADDANATLVKIHYMTLSPKDAPVPLDALSTTPCKRLQVSNNGTPFRPEDWTRLKRIAEGNPDAEKIGAFGVGFYSVFSICDDPFVSSGKECMAFFWNERDQLFVRRRELPTPEPMTTFMLNMRTPPEIPNLPELCRFLATSLTFTRSLAAIELHFDDHKLLTLNRQQAPPSPIPLRTNNMTLTSPQKAMQLTSATLHPVQIKATYLAATQHSAPSTTQSTSLRKLFLSKFSSPAPPTDLRSETQAIAFLRVATASLAVNIGPKFAREFERAQKKAPPRTTQLSMLCVSKGEMDASTRGDPVFAALIPETQGRVYIGFPTHQTTGFRGHVGAPALVPTVERESIDLADAQLRIWNGELLSCVGIFARVLYNMEMENMALRFKPDTQVDKALIAETIHLLNLFTFQPTTPAARVRTYIEESFFASSKDPTALPLLTTQGVKPSNATRLSPTDSVPFLTTTPLLPPEVATGAKTFVDRLVDAEILRKVGWEDVKRELSSRTLSQEHAVQFLRWVLKEGAPPGKIAELVSLAVVIMGDSESGKIVNLGAISSFVVPGHIPSQGGLPPYVLPLELGKTFSAKDLGSFGWTELSVHEWVKFVCTAPTTSPALDIEKSVEFATTVLSTTSKYWDSIPLAHKQDIIALLSAKACIPTVKRGLMKPGETYFHNVKVLPDLPLVESMKGVKEKFLEQLGVRRVVALQLIFDRLGEGRAWSHIDGIKYLASVQNNLTADEMRKLREYPLCPSRTEQKRFVVNQLYEPNPDLEKLDLPILSWPQDSWRQISAEARFLYALGLNRFPTVQTLLQIASKPTNPTETRNRALDFFTTYYHTYEYHRTDFSKVKSAFLPCEPVGGKVFLCNPADVFSNPAAAVYGFYILEKRFLADAGKFGVKTGPPSSTLTNAIIGKPPASPAEAREKFAYAAQRITTFSKSELARLATANIVPVPQKDGKVKYVPPTLCFLDNHARKERVWEDIFDFVDFGERGNVFLEALGVKDTPDASQIGDQLAREPRRIYDAMDIGGYLRLLSMLGTNAGVLQRDKALWTRLRAAPFLLGMKSDVAEDGTTRTIACLAKAEDIVIVDEPRLGVIFRQKLVIAPERDDCEILYVALGSPHLSALVRQKFTQRGSPMTNEETEALRTHIIERAGIFLTVPEITPQVQRKADFLAQNLKIYRYDSLQVERSLVFGRIRATDTERVSAMVDSNVKGCLLLVTDPKTMNWNQVAEALNGVMLRKTNRGMDLLFETILKENLEFLRFRGFAVDRLLNRQMEEQRLAKARKDAEEEERRREEKKRLAALKLEVERLAREAAKPENKVANGGLVEGEKGVLPGAWRDDGSLDANGAPPPYNQLTKPTNPPVTFPTRPGFMNSIKSALGIPNPPLGGLGPLGLEGMGLGGPGGHDSLETDEEPFQAQKPNPQQQAQGPPQPFHTTVEGAPQNISKSAIDTQLQKAKSAVRPLNQNHLFAPATNSVVHEAPQAYCDSTTEQDLESYSPNAPTPWGLETFFPRAQRGEFERMLGAHEADVHFFAGMLKIMAADVFRVRLDSFHLFYDANKRTIAFNRSGSLFFNIAYYLELHAQDGGFSRDAPPYWFTTISHELAHNMALNHGAGHSYWTEAFITAYMIPFWQHFGST